MSKKANKLALTRRRNAAKRMQVRRSTPYGRLSSDGASSNEKIQARAMWLSSMLNLPKVPKIGSTVSEELASYCLNYHVNFDWLLTGDLKGLQRMMQRRRAVGMRWDRRDM